MKTKNKIGAVALAICATLGLGACTDASVASHNLSKDADNFKIDRRVVFYNGITDKYIFEIDGLCSVDNEKSATQNAQVAVTCKTAPGQFEKHILGLSDNVTWFAEQVSPHAESTAHYKVIFKPSTMLPDVDVR